MTNLELYRLLARLHEDIATEMDRVWLLLSDEEHKELDGPNQ